MNLKNLLISLLMVTFLMFVISIKNVNAQSLVQPMIGSITNINAGTDRITEMIQIEIEKEEPPLEVENQIEDISTESDIEIFYPQSETEALQKNKYTLKNESIQSNNENITTKNDDEKSAKNRVIAAVNSGNVKVDTENGGDIKNKIGGMDIAFVRELKTSSGKLIIGGVVDYGHNSYDNNSNAVKGSGNSKAITAGIITKQIRDNGSYYEGSARLGRAKTDFHSNNFVIDNQKIHINYEESAPIYAGHVKVGRIINVNERNKADIYGAYNFAHQDHQTVDLSTKDRLNFGSVNSNCFKIGCRMTTEVRKGKIYYGMAYQYESSAKIKAKNNNDTIIQMTNAKGSSGMLELGYKINANRSKTVGIDINATGFAGQQKGIIVHAQFVKLF